MSDTKMRHGLVTVGPHGFVRLGKILPWRRAKCAACYLPRAEHPTSSWPTARPLGHYGSNPR